MGCGNGDLCSLLGWTAGIDSLRAGKYLHGHNITAQRLRRETTLPAGARPPANLADCEGRYLLLGLDRSLPLLSHAPASAERMYGDGCPGPSALAATPQSLLPFRPGVFDFALSIATIHHFSTPIRRRQGVEALIQTVCPTLPGSSGRFLLYVWAFEQGASSRRRWEKGTLLPALPPPGSTTEPPLTSPADLASTHPQDVFVPWTTSKQATADVGPSQEPQTLNRYYHLFRQGELQDLVRQAADALGLAFGDDNTSSAGRVAVVREGYEADNWFVECVVSRAS